MSAIRYGNRSLKRNRRVVFPVSPPLGLDGENSHGKVPNVVTRSTAKFHPQGFLIPAGSDLGKGEFRCWKPNADESTSNISKSGPGLGMDIHPGGEKIAVAHAIGTKTHPESGALAVFEWYK